MVTSLFFHSLLVEKWCETQQSLPRGVATSCITKSRWITRLCRHPQGATPRDVATARAGYRRAGSTGRRRSRMVPRRARRSHSRSLGLSAQVPEFPVWLNADVLPGPVNATTLAVDVNKFLEKAKTNYPQLMLSLGWTTRWGKGLDDQDQTKVPVEEVKYSQDNVDAMIEALNVSGVKQPITYAVRAAFVANSLKELKNLLEKTPQPDGGIVLLTGKLTWQWHSFHAQCANFVQEFCIHFFLLLLFFLSLHLRQSYPNRLEQRRHRRG